MAESDDKTTTVLGIILFICISLFLGEHRAYESLKKEYLKKFSYISSWEIYSLKYSRISQ